MSRNCGRAGCYRQEGQVLVRPSVLPLLGRVDALVFDIDGVLVDVTDSISTVDCLAVNTYLRLLCGWPEGEWVTQEDAAAFKLAGGFNDDWDLARVMALHQLVKAELARATHPRVLRQASPTTAELLAAAREGGGGYQPAVAVLLSRVAGEGKRRVERQWRPELVQRVFQELYAGETYCPSFYGFTPRYVHVPGLILRDRPLLAPEVLPSGIARLGIFSGRTEAETLAALDLLGLSGYFRREAMAVAEDGPLKPEPDGLARVVAALGAEVAIYVGDMPDDREAVRRYRRLPGTRTALIDCLVLTGPVGQLPREQQLAAGADLVCEDVNQLCRWLAKRREP